MALKFDGLDNAIIGFCTQGPMSSRLAYDYDRIIEILISQGMTEDEAVEFADFNVLGAWMGEDTPIVVTLMSPEEALEVVAEETEEEEETKQ